MNKSARPYLIVLVGVLGASFSGPLIKIALGQGMPPVIIAFWRLLFTAAVLAPFVATRRGFYRELSALSNKDKGVLLLAGVLFALHFITWNMSLQFAATYTAMVLVSINPVIVLFLALLVYGQKPRRYMIPGISLALVGTAVVAFAGQGGGQTTLLGASLALLAAALVAGYMLCGQRMRQDCGMSLGTYTLCVYSIAALVLLCVGLSMGQSLTAYPIESFAACAGLMVLCTLMGHSIFSWALKTISPAAVMVMTLGEPVFGAVIAFALFREIPSWLSMLGGLLTLGGIALYTVLDVRHGRAGQSA